MATKAQQAERDEALDRIREWVKPGDTVFTILRYAAKSGMSRVIQLVVFIDGEPRYLGYNAAKALGIAYDREREGVKSSGCGMDAGFELVYELGRRLWPEGFKVEGRGRNGDTSGWDKDGGYALKHRWL